MTSNTPEAGFDRQVAALATALAKSMEPPGWTVPVDSYPARSQRATAHAAAAILTALDGWAPVNDDDFHAELTDGELATCAAINFGEGLIEGRKESEAEIDRLDNLSDLLNKMLEARNAYESAENAYNEAMARHWKG